MTLNLLSGYDEGFRLGEVLISVYLVTSLSPG